jgi:hypothetical protein
MLALQGDYRHRLRHEGTDLPADLDRYFPCRVFVRDGGRGGDLECD